MGTCEKCNLGEFERIKNCKQLVNLLGGDCCCPLSLVSSSWKCEVNPESITN